MNNRTKSLPLGLVPGLFLAFGVLATFAAHAGAQSLGSAENFAVLGASTVTNTGASVISGSVGVSPGSAITGFFPPGIIINGALHAADATATQAHADFATAYTDFAGLASPPANNLSGLDLGGMTLTPGVYRYNTSATSGGILTFDAQNNPKARFVIQIGTTLITTSSSSVALINGADARNIYFQLGTSATLGSGSSFIGNILAGASITTVSGTNLTGQLLALTGAVTLDTNHVTSPGLTPAQLLNISTRANVQTGDNVTIAGFIVTGNAPKKVIVRGLGPSTGLTQALTDPVLELHAMNGSLITSNDNWKDTQQTEIQNLQNGIFAPSNDLESAIIATLAPSEYTAILRGKNGTTGGGLAEMYDLDLTSDSQLVNISTRGFVQTGNDVMIGGFIFGNGTTSERVIIRAIGPSLASYGVANVLADPMLTLHDSNGAILLSDDNWQDDPSQASAIASSGKAPQNSLESAIVTTLPPGAYTAVVTGKNRGMGVALVEVYRLP
jgi:hypothetical protein